MTILCAGIFLTDGDNMKPLKNKDFNIYHMVARQLDEVADSLEKNIIRELPEDRAMMLQSDNSENGMLLCDKYINLTEEISELREDLMAFTENLNNMSRNVNIAKAGD